MRLDRPLRVGKVPADVIERLLARARAPGGAVLGPGLGRDGAVLDVAGTADRFLVAASDPVTFAADEIGWYAVHVNANDVACMGARPRWFLATVLLPEGAREGDAEAVFDQIDRACAEIGAGLVGGHTEVTPGLDHTVVAGTMLGVTSRWISAGGAQPGDVLLLTKGIAIEGTAILAREAADRVAGVVDAATLQRARDLLVTPGISVAADAAAALRAGVVHALHDPTEGGIAGGIHELCQAAGVGAHIDLDAVPVFPETRTLAGAMGLDPLGLIASGALLIAAPETDAPVILKALRDAGIDATRIGSVEPAAFGIRAGPDASLPLPRFEADELTRVL
ncbi:MAG: AIR synthase family protein [Gemmatimonadota bacterium]